MLATGSSPTARRLAIEASTARVVARVAQRVVDLLGAVDAGQRPQAAVPRGRELGGHAWGDGAVEEQPRLQTVSPGDVLDKFAEVFAQQRVAAQNDEAGRAERHAVVDRPPPLGRGELARLPGIGAVVAVQAGATAAVRHVKVDLTQAQRDGRLAAQVAACGEPLEDGQVGGLVDIQPQRQLDRLEAGPAGLGQRPGEQGRRAHRRGFEHLPQRILVRRPGATVDPHGIVAAIGRRAEHDPARREPVDGEPQVLRGNHGTVAVHRDDRLGAGREQVVEDGGEALSEGLAALLQLGPAGAVGAAPAGGRSDPPPLPARATRRRPSRPEPRLTRAGGDRRPEPRRRRSSPPAGS